MEVRDAQLAVASWLLDFASSGYGPHGASKLVAGPGGETLVRSPALALREAGFPEPLVRPYVELASSLLGHAGDHSTGALLVAARLVGAALERPDVGLAGFLEGYSLAARQSRAVLLGLAEPRSDADCLGAAAPDGRSWAAPLVAGLRRQADGGHLDLAAVDIRAEGGEAAWLDGVVTEPQWVPQRSPAGSGVLLLSAGWKVGLRSEGATYRLRPGADAAAAEAGRREAARSHAQGLGAGLVIAGGGVDEGLCQALCADGALVWTDTPRSAMKRLERATGARLVARLEDATPGDMGRGRFHRRPKPRKGWLVSGSGPAGTFLVPALSGPFAAARTEEAERLLRAAGLHLTDPRAVPGGGRWQRDVAAALRRMADAAPGRAPFGVRAAADAFDGLADLLVRNAGRDPWRERFLPDAERVWDSYPCVRLAVSSAFEAAAQALRVDAVHAKPPSRPETLRGSGRPTLVRAGDVPPLM